jgi:hypothetical protein
MPDAGLEVRILLGELGLEPGLTRGMCHGGLTE